MANDPHPHVAIREAVRDDLSALIAMLASDTVGGHGDTTEAEHRTAYERAFDAIAASPNETLYVADYGGRVVGVAKATVLTTLTNRGASAVLVETVHVRTDMRGNGIGQALVDFCVSRARELGACSVKLMTNRDRVDAHRFYERLGFERSHHGYRMKLG
ncbi:GNAT family N-acetyltransferase [Pararhizobium mangrovi]|uniref:GNAT family N-acetyltransferase n=1 Tax=Pararhizobium mangrovi TaxID=2590452 RepID=A0A506TY20_9HYPH|nr:GNAT family N-acetyltransferase [Pararhizobium mangrovi]TPW25861.1 GNAT family N-acetyltransferase [Pararhizobium mangrovi]